MFDTRLFYLQLDHVHRARPHVVSLDPTRINRPNERRPVRRDGSR